MAKLGQFSEASNLAIHALAYLANGEAGRFHSASRIAGQLGVSETHLGKVLQRLAKFGYLRSSRGAHGGFTLARGADEITLLEIVELLDGPLNAQGCLLGKRICAGEDCVLDDVLGAVHREVRERLGKTWLSEFATALAPGAKRSPGRTKRKLRRRSGR